MDECLYWLWLADAAGSEFRAAGELLREYPCAAELYQDFRAGARPEWLTARACARLEQTEPWQFEAVADNCILSGIAVLTPEDPNYPARLRDLPDAPLVLYATGSTDCLNGRRYVGMVGTRRPTVYGRSACHDLSLGVAKAGAVIVSGLADGLDGVAQAAAVEAGMPTVGFLGTAIDKTFPQTHGELRRQVEALGGCILSEYAPGYPGRQRGTFLARNRLIAGLSEVLCVAEARVRSGTANTVSHAERYGRPVMAVPGSIYSAESEGTNALLQQGRAGMVLRPDDLVNCLDLHAPELAAPKAAMPELELSPQASLLLEHLGPQPVGMDALCAATGLPAPAAMVALMELQFSGKIQETPGRQYRTL